MSDAVNLTGDASQLVSELEKAIMSWQKHSAVMENAIKSSFKYQTEGNKLVRTLEDISASGQKTVLVQKKIGETWKTVSARISHSQRAVDIAQKETEALREKNKALAEENRLKAKTKLHNEKMDASAKYVQGVAGAGWNNGAASVSERSEVVAATNRANKYIRQQGIELKQVEKIWQDLNNNTIRRYGDRLSGLQSKLLNLKKAQENLGSQAQRATQRETEAIREKNKALAEENRLKAKAKAHDQRISRSTKYVQGVAGAGWNHKTATIGERGEVVAATNRANNYIRQQGIELKKVKRIWEDLNNNTIRRYDDRLSGLQSKLLSLKKAQAGLGAQTRRDAAAATRELKKQEEALKRQEEAGRQAWRSIGKLFAVHLAHRAISAVTRALIEGVKEAVRLQKAIAEVQTISQGGKSTQQWFDDSKSLSNAFGGEMADQLEATYQALSNQVVKASDATQFLARANEFADVSVSSTTDSVSLLSSVINSYNKDASSAREISAKLFKTIELGRVRASEMANSLGDITVVANSLSISMDEVFASISTLTRQGMKYNKVATQIRGIMVKLLKPSEKMKEFYKEIGVESGKAAIETYGWIGFLEKLQNTTNGSATELAQYITRMKGLTGVIGLTGKGLESLKTDFGKLQNAQESYDKASEIIYENMGKRAEIARTRVLNAFKDYGNTVATFWWDKVDNLAGFSEDAASERLALLSASTISTELAKTTSEFEKAAAARDRIHRKEEAAYRILLDKQVDAAKSGYAEIADAARDSAKAAVSRLDQGLSETRARITALAREMDMASKKAASLSQQKDDLLFGWKLDDLSSLPDKIKEVTRRIRKLKLEQSKAAKAGDVAGMNSAGDKIIALLKRQRSLSKSVDKENESRAKKRLSIIDQISKLENKKKKSPEDVQELVGLKGELSKLVPIVQARLNLEAKVSAHYREQIALNKELAATKERQIKAEEKLKLEQEIKRTELKRLIADVGQFDLSKVLALSNPEEIIAKISKRTESVSKTIAAGNDAGIDLNKIMGLDKLMAEESRRVTERTSGLSKLRQIKEERAELKKTTDEETKAALALNRRREIQKKLLDEIIEKTKHARPLDAVRREGIHANPVKGSKDIFALIKKQMLKGGKLPAINPADYFKTNSRDSFGQLVHDYRILQRLLAASEKTIKETGADMDSITLTTQWLIHQNKMLEEQQKALEGSEKKKLKTIKEINQEYKEIQRTLQKSSELQTTVQPITSAKNPVVTGAVSSTNNTTNNYEINVTGDGDHVKTARMVMAEIERQKRRRVRS